MCQLCAMKQMAAQERWPRPVEAHKQDLGFLVDSIHGEVTAWEAKKKRNKENELAAPDSLLDMLRMLASQLDVLEAERETWWLSPEKREQRRRFKENGEERKWTELQNINNGTSHSIEALSAKLGGFCKWSLGMNGGVRELVHGNKAKKA